MSLAVLVCPFCRAKQIVSSEEFGTKAEAHLRQCKPAREQRREP